MWVDGHQKMDFSTNVLCCICGRDARESLVRSFFSRFLLHIKARLKLDFTHILVKKDNKTRIRTRSFPFMKMFQEMG